MVCIFKVDERNSEVYVAKHAYYISIKILTT